MADDSDSTLAGIDRDDLPVDPDVPPSDRDLGPRLDPPSAGRTASPRVRPRGRARAEYVVRRVLRVVRNRWDVLIVIAAGGAVGSLGRWGLTVLLPHPASAFPWATFTANVVGCLLLGALMVFVIEVWPPSRYLRPFLGVGVLGGFTTFSTYMLDARTLLVAGRTSLAGQYVFGSLVAGLVAVWVGIVATRLLVRRVGHRRRARTSHDQRPGRRRNTAPLMRSRR